MRYVVAGALLFASIASAAGLPSDLSFMSTTSPATCGTADNAIVTSQQIFGTGTGFACLKTLIFPQFAIGGNWVSQISTFMAPQPTQTGLVNGSNAGFGLALSFGSDATFTPSGSTTPVLIGSSDSGCLEPYDTEKSVGPIPFVLGQLLTEQDSGSAGRGTLYFNGDRRRMRAVLDKHAGRGPRAGPDTDTRIGP